MKRLSEYLAVLAVLTFCTMLACKSEPGGGGDPTPVPQPTAEPAPTEVPPQPTPIDTKPCVFHAQTGKDKVFKGDCAASATCRNGNDGFFYGSSCETVQP